MDNFQKRFPIFSSTIKTVDFGNYAFVFIYHLNDNNAPFLEHWIRKVKTLAVISIPYSEVSLVKQQLSKLTKVITPNTVEEIPSLIEKIVTKWKKKNIILIEIGGYSSFISHKLHNVILAVEDTNQGHWNHLNSKNARSYPVVSMAQSEVKMLENRVIGESIVRTIEKLLKKYFPKKNFHKQTFGNISYGGIGSSVCLALRKRGITPYVYDIDPIKHAFAYSDGYPITSKEKLLQVSDIIIGSSGKNSVLLSDANSIKKGSLLFSGSSKQVEFQELLALEKIKEDDSMFQKYLYKNSYFCIGYNGQPINFLDVVDPEEFDYILATMVACVKYGLENKLSNAVHSIPLKYQIPVFKTYLQKHIRI